MLSYMNPFAVALSVFIGVGGWVCPRALKVNLVGMLVYALWKSMPISASATDATAFFIVLHVISIGPFNLMKKCFFLVTKMLINPQSDFVLEA